MKKQYKTKREKVGKKGFFLFALPSFSERRIPNQKNRFFRDTGAPASFVPSVPRSLSHLKSLPRSPRPDYPSVPVPSSNSHLPRSQGRGEVGKQHSTQQMSIKQGGRRRNAEENTSAFKAFYNFKC